MVQGAHGLGWVCGVLRAHTAVFPRREQEAVASIAAPRSHRDFRAAGHLHRLPRGPEPCWWLCWTLAEPRPGEGGSEQHWGTAMGAAAWERWVCLCRRKGEAVRGLRRRPPRANRPHGRCFPREAPLLALLQQLEKKPGLPDVRILHEEPATGCLQPSG